MDEKKLKEAIDQELRKHEGELWGDFADELKETVNKFLDWKPTNVLDVFTKSDNAPKCRKEWDDFRGKEFDAGNRNYFFVDDEDISEFVQMRGIFLEIDRKVDFWKLDCKKRTIVPNEWKYWGTLRWNTDVVGAELVLDKPIDVVKVVVAIKPKEVPERVDVKIIIKGEEISD